MPLDTTIPTPSGGDDDDDDTQTHPAVVAIQEADSPEDAFGAAVIAMAVDISETPHLVERTTEEFGGDALALLPAPVLAALLALAIAELAEMSLSAERAAEPVPLSEHPSNPDAKVNTEPVSSVLLPIGAYVRVDTTKPTADGGMEPETYIGIIRGYDIGRTKYNVGARFQTWGEWKFGDGGWWCFLSEATEITYQEAHAK